MSPSLHTDLDSATLSLARRRVGRKMGFLIHLGVYVLVNAGLWFLGTLQGDGTRWNHLPLMGWGVGLAIHGIVTFISLAGGDLHGRMLDAEVERLRKSGR